VFKIMKGFGQHIQLSVFRCDLTEADRLQMEAALAEEIDAAEDQILVVDLGPSDGRRHHVRAIGRPTSAEKRGARIL